MTWLKSNSPKSKKQKGESYQKATSSKEGIPDRIKNLAVATAKVTEHLRENRNESKGTPTVDPGITVTSRSDNGCSGKRSMTKPRKEAREYSRQEKNKNQSYLSIRKKLEV